LDLNTAVATLHGKGRKIRHCPLWKVTVAALRELVATRPNSEAVFLSQRGQPLTRYGIHTLIERHVCRAAVKVPTLKTKRISPHCLRHYADLRTMPTGAHASLLDAPSDRAFVDSERAFDAA
jgi:integrase